MPSQNTEERIGNQDVNHGVSPITTIDALRALLGKPAKALEKRVQTTLDEYSVEFIELATTAVLATDDSTLPMHFVDCRQESPFIVDSRRLSLSHHFSRSALKPNSCKASLYFFIAGIGHALRVNGQLLATENMNVEFRISGLYFHCARAAARAQLWDQKESKLEIVNEVSKLRNPAKFLEHSPYVLMKSQNTQGVTEVSPRGDGSGFIHQLSSNILLIPERPGNKIAISLSNIIEQPKIELLCLIPGSNLVLNISGHAKITTSLALLEHCSVKGKRPKLGILVEIESHFIREDSTLSTIGLWDSNKCVDAKSLTSFSKALSAHINGTGLLGKITSGVVKAVVNHDMKNLY